MRQINPGADHGGRGVGVGVGRAPGDHSQGAVLVGGTSHAERSIRKNDGRIGAGGNRSVAGDLEGSQDRAKACFLPPLPVSPLIAGIPTTASMAMMPTTAISSTKVKALIFFIRLNGGLGSVFAQHLVLFIS